MTKNGGEIMDKRPELKCGLDATTFKNYNYLKSELVEFCKENNLQTTGGKIELADRVFKFLSTGEKQVNKVSRKAKSSELISLDSIIQENFAYSEKCRAFYKTHIGDKFKFCVPFQKWLKENVGKTYKDSIDAYCEIIKNKDISKKDIDKQFEYNTYIRDFFEDNKDKNFRQAVCCWNYKKSIKGTNRYEKSDLIALDKT